MSVLIKGMDMPKRCWNCPLKKIDGMDIVCDVLRERVAIADDKILMGRLDRCPLVGSRHREGQPKHKKH